MTDYSKVRVGLSVSDETGGFHEVVEFGGQLGDVIAWNVPSDSLIEFIREHPGVTRWKTVGTATVNGGSSERNRYRVIAEVRDDE